MNNRGVVLYNNKNPTLTDLDFMMESQFLSFPSSATSTSSSTASDAQSAPPDLDSLFVEIEKKCEELVLLSNRQLPPEWNMADLIRTVMGNDALQIPGHLQDTYYDVILRGATSWLFEDLGNFIDLINYAL